MSYLNELAERHPDLFTEAERKTLTARSDFEQWKLDLLRRVDEYDARERAEETLNGCPVRGSWKLLPG